MTVRLFYNNAMAKVADIEQSNTPRSGRDSIAESYRILEFEPAIVNDGTGRTTPVELYVIFGIWILSWVLGILAYFAA